MYLFTEKSDKYISLHDCRATALALNGNELSFTFADGICLGKKHPRNTYGKTLRPGEAQVSFNLPAGKPDENVTCYVFFEKKNGTTLRKQFSVEKLMRKINEKGRPLKFLHVYRSGNTLIYKCALRRNKKPGSRECQLILRTESVSYSWNDLQPEKK